MVLACKRVLHRTGEQICEHLRVEKYFSKGHGYLPVAWPPHVDRRVRYSFMPRIALAERATFSQTAP
jgi:hypothetical protein